MEAQGSHKDSHAYQTPPGNSFLSVRLWATIPRIVLLALSVVSFFPHYEFIWFHGDCWGFSGAYVLINLIAATEQFTLMTLISLAPEYKEGNVIRTPSNAHTWLNMAQCLATWFNQLILFGLFIIFSSSSRVCDKFGMILAYLAFLVISIVPVVFILYPPASSGKSVRAEAQALLSTFDRLHLTIVSPLITALRIFGCSAQVQERVYGTAAAVMTDVVTPQTLIFYALTAVWLVSFYLSPRVWRFSRPLRWKLGTWYKFVGWAAVDSFVFASTQGRIWLYLNGWLE